MHQLCIADSKAPSRTACGSRKAALHGEQPLTGASCGQGAHQGPRPGEHSRRRRRRLHTPGTGVKVILYIMFIINKQGEQAKRFFARVVLHASLRAGRSSFFARLVLHSSVHARQQCQPASRRHGAGAQVAGFPRHCDALCGPSVIPLGIGGWAAIMISEACMMSDQRGCHSPGCFSRPVLDIRRGRARTWLLSWR